MASKKESVKLSKFDRGLNSKVRDQDEHTVEIKPKPSNDVPNGVDKPLQLKVEMTHLVISEQAKVKILETLKFVNGEDFEAKNKADYRDKKSNLSQQYWIDRGHLVIQGTTDYSSIRKKPMMPHEKVNLFALNALEKFGFHAGHCTEALQLTGGDVGKACEILISCYMALPLPDTSIQVPEDVLLERSEELESLQGIFPDICEERIANQLWIIHLDLPYLAANYGQKVQTELEMMSGGSSQNSARNNNKVCEYFLKGSCKFGARCNFAHSKPNSTPVTRTAEIHEKDRTKFDLEIRFPQGCCYPKEPALVAFSPLVNYMPSNSLLRLTYYLQNFCIKQAENEFACVYDLITKLQENHDEILSVVNGRGPSSCLLDPAVPLRPKSDVSDMEQPQSDDLLQEIKTSRAEVTKEMAVRHTEGEDTELARRFQRKQDDLKYQLMVKSRKQLPAYSKIEEILKTVCFKQKFLFYKKLWNQQQLKCLFVKISPHWHHLRSLTFKITTHGPPLKNLNFMKKTRCCQELKVRSNQVVVVSGATGCGKSTQVPQFILDDWLQRRHKGDTSHVEIVCTQPRRLSAIGVAQRVASERSENVGNSVGYSIRLENKISSKTRLTFCTTGILLKRLEKDTTLSSVSHIIVDEVHERSEESDFLLLIMKKLQPVRPDIRIILMSATLNAKLFCEYFNNVPVIDIPGRTFPVEQLFLEDVLDSCGYVVEENSQYTRHLSKSDRNNLESELETELELADIKTGEVITNEKITDQNLTIKQLFYRYREYSANTCKTLYLMDPDKINYELIEHVLEWIVEGDHGYPREGSVLVFLPGMQEIREMHKTLSNNRTFKSDKYKLIPLHSSLSNEEQAEVFSRPKRGERKIVLSTNIAETSITIDDCVFVIDTGRMKEKRFDSNKNMESLETVWVSRANALQRKGRAGRVMPGVCFHLFTQHHFDYQLKGQPVPEIQRVPLEQLLLRIKMLPSFSGSSLKQVLGEIIEPPAEESVTGAITRLFHVGALDNQEDLTPLGCHLAALPVDVRIGKLLLYGAMFNCLDSVLTIAASLSQKTPFVMPFEKRDEVKQKQKEFNISNSDHFTILRAYNKWRLASKNSVSASKVFANENFMNYSTLLTLVGIKAQFLDYLVSIGFVPENCRMHQKRSGQDRILDVTGPELNVNGENFKLLAGLLSASLYPNIVKVLSPEKYYSHSVVGAVPKDSKPEELKFKTKSDGYVHLHPTSVNHNVGHFASPYLVYQEKMKTSKVFIRDCTMVPIIPLIMFSTNKLEVELTNGEFTISLEDGWIIFIVSNHIIGELLQSIQKELIKLLAQKIENPSMNIFTDPRGNKIISTITYLVTHG